MAKKCSAAKCTCDTEFIAPMSALWQIYDAIGDTEAADVVAIAWEREDGKVYRYDLPIPTNLDSKDAKYVSYVVERIAKFIVWSAGGWKLYLAGPDAVVVIDKRTLYIVLEQHLQLDQTLAIDPEGC